MASTWACWWRASTSLGTARVKPAGPSFAKPLIKPPPPRRSSSTSNVTSTNSSNVSRSRPEEDANDDHIRTNYSPNRVPRYARTTQKTAAQRGGNGAAALLQRHGETPTQKRLRRGGARGGAAAGRGGRAPRARRAGQGRREPRRE